MVALHVAVEADGLGGLAVGGVLSGLGGPGAGQLAAQAHRARTAALDGADELAGVVDLHHVAGLPVGAAHLEIAVVGGSLADVAAVVDLTRAAGGLGHAGQLRQVLFLGQIAAVAGLQVHAVDVGQLLACADARNLQHAGRPVGASELVLVHLVVRRAAHPAGLGELAGRAGLGGHGLHAFHRIGVAGEAAVDRAGVLGPRSGLAGAQRHAVERVGRAAFRREDHPAQTLLAYQLVDLGGGALAVLGRLARGDVGVGRGAVDRGLLDQLRRFHHRLGVALRVTLSGGGRRLVRGGRA